MKSHLGDLIYRAARRWQIVVSGIVVFCCAGLASAQILTPMYTFESGLQGFTNNPASFGTTVSLNTDTNFVSQGTQSMKIDLADFASFEGILTSEIDTGILNDPPGVDFLRFDLINTNRFAPENPEPGDPTFADMGVSLFGEFTSNPGTAEHIQFQFSQTSVGNLEPGTHSVDIDLTNGGLLIGTAQVKGFNDWIADGFSLYSLQFYVNKSSANAAPAFAWSFYMDNIRTGINVEGLAGNYNGNNEIDAADYATWRDAMTAGATDLLNDSTPGTVDESDFLYWRDHFGESLGSGAGSASAAVPEPSSALLLLICGACWCLKRMGGSIRRKTAG